MSALVSFRVGCARGRAAVAAPAGQELGLDQLHSSLPSPGTASCWGQGSCLCWWLCMLRCQSPAWCPREGGHLLAAPVAPALPLGCLPPFFRCLGMLLHPTPASTSRCFPHLGCPGVSHASLGCPRIPPAPLCAPWDPPHTHPRIHLQMLSSFGVPWDPPCPSLCPLGPHTHIPGSTPRCSPLQQGLPGVTGLTGGAGLVLVAVGGVT